MLLVRRGSPDRAGRPLVIQGRTLLQVYQPIGSVPDCEAKRGNAPDRDERPSVLGLTFSLPPHLTAAFTRSARSTTPNIDRLAREGVKYSVSGYLQEDS